MTETLEMTAPPAAAPSPDHRSAHVARRWWGRLLGDTAYTLSAGVIAVPAFAFAVVGLSAGVGLLVVAVGVPVLALTVLAARGFAHLERSRLPAVLGRPAPAPVYLTASPTDSVVRRTLTPLRDLSSWLDVTWSVIGLATGLTAFAVTVGWWAGVLGGLTYWWWQRFITFGPDSTTFAELIGLGRGRTPESLLNLGLGLVALLTLPLVVRLMALVHGSVADVLLCSRARLQGEVVRVSGGRDAARRAEVSSLRRLERDIHDGPQQRLVRLQMELGRADKQLDVDPDRARGAIGSALQQARETVEELRALSRGIAPPVLVDRGLEAALHESFARSPVPVHGEVDVAELPPLIETTVYFVVAEALTNAAKHAAASRVDVRVRTLTDAVRIEVTDDGVGGAEVGKGHGLAGLEQRVRSVDGTLRLASPVGGPTTLLADIPCGRERH